jgi:hypothetical protein
MLIKLDYSGHYPRLLVDVSDEEWAQIQKLTEKHYLFDTKEGRNLLNELEKRGRMDKTPTVIAYM